MPSVPEKGEDNMTEEPVEKENQTSKANHNEYIQKKTSFQTPNIFLISYNLSVFLYAVSALFLLAVTDIAGSAA